MLLFLLGRRLPLTSADDGADLQSTVLRGKEMAVALLKEEKRARKGCLPCLTSVNIKGTSSKCPEEDVWTVERTRECGQV